MSTIVALLSAWTVAGGSAGPSVWGFPGHRVVCEIAWQEMTPNAKSEAARLTLAFGGFSTFAESCVWADGPDAKNIHNSHWVNTSLGDDAITMADCPTDCVLRHLAAELSLLDDASNSDAVRARALMFIGHFVGDIHQPLHAGYASDRGGNRHRIRGASGGNDLHYVWDSYFIRNLAQDWRQYGQDLHADINPIDPTVWVDDGAAIEDRMLTWANESFRIVEDYVYEGLTGPGDRELGPTYVQGNLPTIERQLKKAGLRLGQLLNEVLDP